MLKLGSDKYSFLKLIIELNKKKATKQGANMSMLQKYCLSIEVVQGAYQKQEMQ